MERISRRNRRITIRSIPYSTDAEAGLIGASSPRTTVASVWADVESISGTEQLLAQQITAEVSHRIGIAYRTGVTPKMEVLMGSRTFRIEVVKHDEAGRQETNLFCKEIS